MVIYCLQSVQIRKYHSEGTLFTLALLTDAVHTVVHGVTVKYAREFVNGAQSLETVQQLVIGDLGSQEKCGKFQCFLDIYRVFDIKIGGPDITQKVSAGFQR